MNALDVTDLSVTLDGRNVIRNITFSVPQNTTTAILGPNGAGKSVLIKAILRLLPKSSGTVRIMGIDHKQYSKIAPLISYIPQRLEFTRHFPLTVEGLFSLKSPRPLGMSANQRNRMDELLHRVGMEHYKAHKISNLSGGQLQRVLVAYSLMDHPKILVLDEPSAGIDAKGQETIYDLLRRIQKEEHITMILISHEIDVVMEYADQVLCLNAELLCAGLPRHVLTSDVLEQTYGTPIGKYIHKH